jgi:hypothetical protein
VKETQAIKRARVDAVVDGFDLVRKRLNPTNGECLAIFTVLAADILNASGDVADELLRPARSVLNTMGQDGECLRALFERCGLPTRAPKKQILEAPNQTPVDPLAVHAVVQRADDFLHGRVSASYSETIVKQLMQALTEAVAARQQALGLLQRWAYPDGNVPWEETKTFLSGAASIPAPPDQETDQ